MDLLQYCVTSIVSKNIQYLVLSIWWSIHDRVSVACGDPEGEQGPKVATVTAIWLWTFQVSATVTMATQRYILLTTNLKMIISIMERNFLQLFWMVSLALSLSWMATLSCLSLITWTKALQAATASYDTPSRCGCQTWYIFEYNMLNAAQQVLLYPCEHLCF